jgi:hypothetical protein
MAVRFVLKTSMARYPFDFAQCPEPVEGRDNALRQCHSIPQDSLVTHLVLFPTGWP